MANEWMDGRTGPITVAACNAAGSVRVMRVIVLLNITICVSWWSTQSQSRDTLRIYTSIAVSTKP